MFRVLQEPICYGTVCGIAVADVMAMFGVLQEPFCYGDVWGYCRSWSVTAVFGPTYLPHPVHLTPNGASFSSSSASPRVARSGFAGCMACSEQIRGSLPHLSFVPPRSRSCSQSSHHALSSSPACTHTPRCIRTPTLCAGLAFRMSFSGTTSRRWRVRPFSEHACALEGRVLVVSPESRTCLEHALHGFAELAWPSPLVAVQVVTSRSASRLGPPVLARLARPCLNRLRESWTCPAGTRPPRASTPAPALSPAVLGRPLDAVARRRGPRLRPVRADPDVVNSRRVVRCSPARLLRRARDQTRRPRRGQSTGRSR